MTEQHNINRLPVWARDRITQLESNVEHYQEQVRQMSTADTTVTWRIGDEERHGLPTHAHIAFRTSRGVIEVDLRNGALYIYGHDGTLNIQPAGGVNTVKICQTR